MTTDYEYVKEVTAKDRKGRNPMTLFMVLSKHK
jgi:hypothetical protein